MPPEIRREIGSFTADFRDGKVTVGGETFLSGYFFTNAMNEYWQPYSGSDGANFEIAPKLLVMKSGAKVVREELTLGYLYPPHAEKLYDEILYKINTIARTKPFCFLDLEAEREQCKQLFSEESVQKICAYLRKRAMFHFEDENGWANHPLPRQDDVDEFRSSQALLEDYLSTMTFYEEIGQGMDNAHEIGKAFVTALEQPTKRTESNLMTMALSCIEQYRPGGFTEFERVMRVQTEYVPVPKKKKQDTYEIGRRMSFERFGDFLLADFFEGLHAGHYPLRCGVCKRYFLQTTAHRRKYCDGYAPNDPKDRSCEAFAARSNRLAKELAPDHHVKEIYNRRRGTINKHLERAKITEDEAKAAKRYIEDLLDHAIADNDYFLNGYAEDMEMEAVYATLGIKPL
ncbi:hypothetical protein FACS1894171_0740 [Clostridia bacterium]|nr:hypothetical protein FACS1894171_0740 [Clostridia bacterium]